MKKLESVKLVQFLLYEQQEFVLDEVTGLFGRNGSGKSAVLDAIQIAIFGANKNLLAFNAQADSGTRQQNRTLRSYSLGQFGDDADQCARNLATTYITLVWRDMNTLEPVSMGVCIEASSDNEVERVLGRYVIRGVELAMADHLQTVDGITAPLPWSSFRHRLLDRSNVTGEVPLFDDASSYVKQVLFMLRGRAGQASYDAFARAFRFALRMRFDKSVDQIVRQDVLEDRPTNIQKFKSIVETFKRLNMLVESVEKKISQGRKVADSYQSAMVEARRSATWKGLKESALHEHQNVQHEVLTQRKGEAEVNEGQLRDKSELAQERVVAMKGEIEHQTTLQQAHADHKENAQAQQERQSAEGRVSSRANEFGSELKNLGLILQNTRDNKNLAKWRDRLQDASDRLQQCAQTQGEPDIEALQKVMREMGTIASAATKDLEATLLDLANKSEEAGKQINMIAASLERANSGRAQLSDATQYLINELREHGLDPTPVCDLVRVTDPEWQPAIEAYLGRNVEALLMRDSEEEKAFEIYRGLQGRRAIYGVKIVRASRMRPGATPPADSVANLIEGSGQGAVAYLRGKLGNLKRAERSGEALRSERTLTRDGMLVGPGDFERLEPVPANRLRIGAGAKTQVDSLRTDLKRLRLEAQAWADQSAALVTLRTALQTLSANGTERLLLSNARNLKEALQEREVARQRVALTADAEYLALCDRLIELKRKLPTLEGEERSAQADAVRADQVMGQLQEQYKESEATLKASAERQERCRKEADYDATFASDQWDKLLEQFAENYQGMEDHCASLAERCNKAVERHSTQAGNLLGAYLSEYREAVSEDVSSEWRKGKDWIEQQVARLQDTELPLHKEHAQEAYKASQDTFRQDVALALNANLKLMHETFGRLNKSLTATPAFTNGERYQFIAKLRPDLEPLHKFVKNVADFGADGGLFGEPGNLPPQFEDLLREKSASGNAAVKSPLDDYREFYEFDIRIDREDPLTGETKTAGHLSKRIGPGSGGEHRAPLYVIAGAALSSAYRMDKDNRDGLRLILLDEAFDKMDPSNIVATMKYLDELGLQVLMASPGENLGTLTAFLHRYYEIQKDPDRHIIQVEERRVSEAMRQQFREDLWEFHHELLEQELIAVRQQSVIAPVTSDVRAANVSAA